MAEHHEFMDGKLHVYKRENSRHWQCSTYLNGRNWRKTTKEESLAHARDIAEDWYLELKGKARAGLIKQGKKFKDASAKFLLQYPVLTAGERNQEYVDSKESKIRNYLNPFFGEKYLSEITDSVVRDYRIHRMQTTSPDGTPLKPPARSTLHSEIVTLRQVLQTARSEGWLSHLPDLSSPYKASGKIGHRAWFSPEEYKRLFEATRSRAQTPLHNKHRWACEQFHDYVLFMANTGLRPDEAARLQFRDVKIVKDAATKETILEIEVRGKRGTGWCKSTTGAVIPFKRLQDRPRPLASSESGRNGNDEPGNKGGGKDTGNGGDNGKASGTRKVTSLPKSSKPQPTDLLFPMKQHGLFNTILADLGLKRDREDKVRTSYSLRHTYICFRLMEGADIYQIAKNCRTSVEMIEKHYAAHIKTLLDASAINTRRGTIKRERRPLA